MSKIIFFDADIAKEYGRDEAIMMQNVAFWVAKNEANGKHFHEGRYWSYNSTKALMTLFPFWSRGQINRIIESCKKKGLLLTGNFSKDSRDRTRWFALSENWKCISRNREAHFLKSGNVFPEIGKSIPLYNTDNIPDNNTDNNYDNTDVLSLSDSRKSDAHDDVDLSFFLPFYNKTLEDAGSQIPRLRSLTQRRKSALNARIKDYSLVDCETVVKKAAESPFLNGRTDAAWTGCDFDWLFKPNNFIKVLEGKYDKRDTPAQKTQESRETHEHVHWQDVKGYQEVGE